MTKAVIPAAGLGTRFLPATKATPKEMLPVVDKPAIQYVVEEAVAAGLDRRLMVTGRNKRAARGPLRPRLGARGGAAGQGRRRRGWRGCRSRTTSPTCTTSGRATRAGSGTRCCAPTQHVGDEPFAVLLGDDLIDERDPLLVRDDRACSAARRQRRRADGGAARAGAPLRLRGRRGRPARRTSSAITDLVEKPAPTEAPSNLAVIGRYVLAPADLRGAPGHRSRGAAARSSSPTRCRRSRPRDGDGGGRHGVVFRGRRYDTGDRLDYLKAVVQLACERADLGPDFRAVAARATSRPWAPEPRGRP